MPALQVNEAQVYNIIAVSMLDLNADPNAEVLTKEDDSWNDWDENEE